MKELVDKISDFHVFSFLLPGVIFAIIADKFTIYNFIQHDVIVGAFVYYFIGLVISRFGSLVIEPLLKKSGFLVFIDYKRVVTASQKDSKIDLFSQQNNIYRSFCTIFILLLVLKWYELIEKEFPILTYMDLYLLIVLLLIMFLFSYRKQTRYIIKRV